MKTETARHTIKMEKKILTCTVQACVHVYSTVPRRRRKEAKDMCIYLNIIGYIVVFGDSLDSI